LATIELSLPFVNDQLLEDDPIGYLILNIGSEILSGMIDDENISNYRLCYETKDKIDMVIWNINLERLVMGSKKL